MRFLNVKATIIFLVVVIVLVGGTALLHSYQITRHSSTFYDMAVAAWNDKPRRDTDAFQSMRDYLALKPTDFKAKQEYGGWLAESGHFNPAATLLEELVRDLEKQTPPDKTMLDDVHRSLVVIWMDDLHNQSAAESHLKALLQPYHLDHPEQIDADGANLLWRLGDCQRKQDKEKDAIESYKMALANEANKGRVDIWYDLAMTYRFKLESLDGARKCMAEMIAAKQNAESPHAHQIYGMWLEELGEFKEALEQAEITLKLKPDDAGALYLAGKSALNLGDLPKAEEFAERGLKAAPQEAPPYILMADISMRGDPRSKSTALGALTGTEKAAAILKKGVETVNTKSAKVQLLFSLANLDLDGRGGGVSTESIDAAKECIRLMREYHFSPEQLKFLEARIDYANGDWEKARKEFEDVRPSLADLPPQMRCLEYWIGYCYLQQGNPDQAMVAFRRSLGYDKSYFKARDQIAQIFISKGAYRDALEEYRQALMGNAQNDDAWVAYARTVLLCTVDSKNEDPRKWEVCAQELNRIYQRTKSGQIVMFMVEANLAIGKPEAAKEAEKMLADLQKNSPKSAAIWVARANIEARHGNLDKALAIVDEAKAKLGDDYLLRLAHASYLCREKGDQAGPDIDALAANLDAYSEGEKFQLLNGLFNNLMDIKDFDRAKEFGRRIAKLQPRDAAIRYRLLELDMATHNVHDPAASLADIDRLLEELKAFTGQGPLWLYGKAVRLWLEAANHKPELFDQAMKFALEAQRLRLNWSRPQVLMGEICHAQGNDDEALKHYLQASVSGDHDLDFNRKLLQMLKERQLYQEEEQVLHRLESNQVDLSDDLTRMKVYLEINYGGLDPALQDANMGYNPNSDDYRDHLWHGQMLRTLAARARADARSEQCAAIVVAAEKSLRKAIEIAPDSADCRVELVMLLAADNQMNKARRAAAEAGQRLSGQVAPLALACMFEAIGDGEKARASYEKALEHEPDRPQLVLMLAEFYIRNHEIDRAASLVDKLLGGALDVSEADRMKARRIKANLLLAEGQFTKLKQAMALIEENLNSPSSTREDKSIKARILAADPATARDAGTIKILEDLVRAGGADPRPNDRYALACLYDGSNQWAKCREQMEKLVGQEQCDPGYVAAYIKMLLDHEQLIDASLLLERLERVGKPGSAVPLRAEWMFRRKAWGEVTSFLTAFLRQPKAVPEDPSQRRLLVAGLFEDFGKRLTAPPERATAQGYFDEAAKLLEVNAKDSPAGQLTLASFYARRGRLAEAIKLLQQNSGKADAMQLAVAAVAIVNAEKITKEQLQQLEEILTAAAAARKQPVILLAAEGALKITQGQPDQAEALYRKILAVDPNNIIALNNLAMLLALTEKDANEALKLIDRAIELAGAQPRLRDSRAVVLIKRGEPQHALEELEAILADTSEKVDPVWLFHKAWAHDSSDNKDAARDDMAKAGKEPYNLDRSKIDPPERAEYDKLIEDLKE